MRMIDHVLLTSLKPPASFSGKVANSLTLPLNSHVIVFDPAPALSPNMSNPLQRYQKLRLKESLPRIYRYPIACKELCFILRSAYNKLPKNLQSLIFQDTLTAFHLLPQMQTSKAVSAAHLLHQSAEVALPKQKRNLAITEFKQAMVAHKRHYKARQEEKGSAQLPQDVLVHIFSFLDIQSLVSVGLVCWSWNLAASEDYLWQLQYASVFCNSDKCLKRKGHQSSRPDEDQEYILLQEDMATRSGIDWREAFKRAYLGNASKNLTSNRGYCGHCDTIAWINNMKCSDGNHGLNSKNQQIKPTSPRQVAEYILDDSLKFISSSDSDSDSDEGPISRLWAYPRHMSRLQQ
ncbi:F-box protein At5g52880 [Juglans regia]|uniref:F-box protein At5g52880 n=1 Tax=Juglans regia TaxID=51240 RepID=A0A6P9E3U5_JUGRE|nr:F-box protein At5g52880 [Juglans regia]